MYGSRSASLNGVFTRFIDHPLFSSRVKCASNMLNDSE